MVEQPGRRCDAGAGAAHLAPGGTRLQTTPPTPSCSGAGGQSGERRRLRLLAAAARSRRLAAPWLTRRAAGGGWGHGPGPPESDHRTSPRCNLCFCLCQWLAALHGHDGSNVILRLCNLVVPPARGWQRQSRACWRQAARPRPHPPPRPAAPLGSNPRPRSTEGRGKGGSAAAGSCIHHGCRLHCAWRRQARTGAQPAPRALPPPPHLRMMAPRSLAVRADQVGNTACAAAMAVSVSSPFILGRVAMGLPVAGFSTCGGRGRAAVGRRRARGCAPMQCASRRLCAHLKRRSIAGLQPLAAYEPARVQQFLVLHALQELVADAHLYWLHLLGGDATGHCAAVLCYRRAIVVHASQRRQRRGQHRSDRVGFYFAQARRAGRQTDCKGH